MKIAIHPAAAITAAVSAALVAAPALAQTTAGSGALEEIIVTAQKRSENLQDVPISVQALDGSKLAELQVQSFDDYLRYLPSLASQTYGPGQSQLYVRGVTNGGDGLHVGSQPLVGVYLDEMPVTTIANNLDVHVYDMARIEQLSGPQGTLFGASSMAGTVRLITNQPSTAGYASGYNLNANTVSHGTLGGTAEGFVNVPLGERAAVRLVAFAEHDSGYIDNVAGPPETYPTSGVPRTNAGLTANHYNKVDTTGGRGAFKFDFSDRWTAVASVSAQHQDARGTFAFAPSAGDLKVSRYTPEYNHDNWWQSALTVTGKVFDLDFTYAGGYLKRHVETLADYTDYAFFYDTYYHDKYINDPYYSSYATYFGDNFRNDAGQRINPAQDTLSRNDYAKFSHELRLATPKDWRVHGVAGVFLERQMNTTRDEYRVPGLARVLSITGQPGVLYENSQDRVDRDRAAFADLGYDLTPKLSLTGGLREYSFRNTVYGFFGYNGLPKGNGTGPHASGEVLCHSPPDPNNHFRPCINIDSLATHTGNTWRTNLSYKPSDDQLYYLQLSTGYRPGGVNRVASRPNYNADSLRNIEAGWKTTWHEGRVRFNGAFFHEKWHDAQFGITGENGITEIVNAGDSTIYGLESDLQWAASRQWLLSTSFTWLHSRLDQNACNYASPSLTCTEPRSDGKANSILAPAGSRLPVSPAFKGNVVARYKFNVGDLDSHVQLASVFQGNALPSLESSVNDVLGRQPGYASFDFSAGVGKGGWTAELYVDNLLDRRGEQARYAGCEPTICKVAYVVPIHPRVIGLNFGQKF